MPKKLIVNKKILLALILKRLSRMKVPNSRIYIVGGVVTDGYTKRDIDVVVTNLKDIKLVSKALKDFKDFVHILYQKNKPFSRIYLTIDTKIPANRLTLGPRNESPFAKNYASKNK